MAIDVSKLQVSVAEGARWRRTLSITVPRDLVMAERKAAMKTFSARLRLPGFRAGKIPPAVVEKRFGPALDQELIDRVIGDAYRGVVEERSLRPISEGQVGQVNYRPEADLSFEVSFDVAPDLELARLGGFKVARTAVQVGDEEVERVLLRVREREGTWVPLEGGKPSVGERVQVRIEHLDEAATTPTRPYEFILGAGEAVAEIERAIESLEVGSSGEFTIEFPEPHSEEEHAAAAPGHTHGTVARRLRIHVDGRSKLDLPELTDEFARKTGAFESVAILRAKIREDLVAEAEREADTRLREDLIDQVLSANAFEIPTSMVDRFIRSALGDPKDLSEENWAEARKQLGPSAERGVKRHLVVTRIAEANQLTASEKDLDARIEEIATKNSVTPSEVYSGLQRAGRLERLEREITEENVFRFLRERSEVS